MQFFFVFLDKALFKSHTWSTTTLCCRLHIWKASADLPLFCEYSHVPVNLPQALKPSLLLLVSVAGPFGFS